MEQDPELCIRVQSIPYGARRAPHHKELFPTSNMGGLVAGGLLLKYTAPSLRGAHLPGRVAMRFHDWPLDSRLYGLHIERYEGSCESFCAHDCL